MSPIFVTGLPRSGTSAFTGALAVCGGWIGKSAPGGPLNAKTPCENFAVRERILKPLLDLMGLDPLGLEAIPDPGTPPLVDPKIFRDRVVQMFVKQGWSPGVPLVYKDCKLVLCLKQWQQAFPGAKWVVVKRPVEDVIASCLRAEPMTRRVGCEYDRWLRWSQRYQVLVDQVKPIVTVDSPLMMSDPGYLKDVVDKLGLTWREREVREWVDKELWHGRT